MNTNQSQSPKTRVKREVLERETKRIFVLEFFEAIAAAAIVAILLRVFIVGFYRVPTESMMPTLIPGDFIVAWKTSYGVPIPFSQDRIATKTPDRGDVVIFQMTEEDAIYVKRVVGLPGDRIEIRDGKVSVNEAITTLPAESVGDWDLSTEVNGKSTHRVMSRRSRAEADFLAPMVVPPGHVFLLGDLRSESVDSRQWGPVPIEQVFARAAFIGVSLKLTVGSSGASETAPLSSVIDELPQGLATRANLAPTGNFRLERTFKTIE